jgi:kynurenine formamidase
MTVRDPKEFAKDESPRSPERRGFMKLASLAGVAAAAKLATGAPAEAQGRIEPAQAGGARWWPSRWGADDQAGASNWITPEKVLDAVKSIKDGKIYRIGRVYESGMPAFGGRAFALRIPGTPTGGPFGANKLVYHDEFLSTEVGQTGTQFDGLGHIGIQLGKDGDLAEMRYYNGATGLELASAYGLKKLGIENVKPFFTRGHLFDIQGVRGAMMDVGNEVTMGDVRAAMQKQNIAEADVKQGDALFFNTGWGSLWMKNNDRYMSGEPGIGLEVGRWAIEKGACVCGADSWGVEAVPNPDKSLAFPVHGELITKNGIFIHENLNFEGLLADRKYQFVYVFSPAPIKGGTGSNGGPIAIT